MTEKKLNYAYLYLIEKKHDVGIAEKFKTDLKGVVDDDKIFIDYLPLPLLTARQTELKKVFEVIPNNACLYILSLLHFSSTPIKIIEMLSLFASKNIQFISLDDEENNVLRNCKELYEFVNLIRRCGSQILKTKKEFGLLSKGRPLILNEDEIIKIYDDIKIKKITREQVAKKYNLSVNTIFNLFKKNGDLSKIAYERINVLKNDS